MMLDHTGVQSPFCLMQLKNVSNCLIFFCTITTHVKHTTSGNMDCMGKAPISDTDSRVATKIFEDFREALFMEFIKGREPVSSVTTLGP